MIFWQSQQIGVVGLRLQGGREQDDRRRGSESGRHERSRLDIADRERSARQGLNPKTGDKIKIPAKRVPAFTAGKLFKDRVQG